MRNKHTLGMLVAAAALAAGGGMAGASTGATEPGASEPAASAAGGGSGDVRTGTRLHFDPAAEVHRHRVFDQANQGGPGGGGGARHPAAEFLGPTADNSVAGQIDIVTNAATQGRRRHDDVEQCRRPDRPRRPVGRRHRCRWS